MNEFSAADQYLESMVLTASPPRLRLLLIYKANQLCDELLSQSSAAWDDGKLLHLRDVLGELLGGVRKDGGELGEQVSDLYVFLLKHLTRAEMDKDAKKLGEIRSVIQIEMKTWEEYCQKATAPLIPPTNLATQSSAASGNFSLEM